MKTKIAGHLLVECLLAQGVTHAFGVPGESYLAVLDGFHLHSDAIRFVTCRQEGGAAFMAEAQGKLTGRPGICFVTRGPGATNASIGVHTAFQDSTPMVLFVGDVASDTRDREAFQEMDYTHFFGPSTKGMAKRVERIDDPERLPEYIARAFATAMNGRPGPVVLVLPEDMLTQPVQKAQALPRVEPVQAWSDPGALRDLRNLLLAAQKPLVICGGGGWTVQAAQALQRFAENWQLPVANAFRFQDTFDNHHAQYAGDVGIGISPALAQCVRESDLVLAIGPRLGEMTTGGYTLIEVIVAFALLALGLTLLLGTLSGATRQVRVAADGGRAALHAQSLLDELDMDAPLRPLQRDGDFEDGIYRWRLSVQPWREAAVEAPIAPVAGQGPRLLEVELDVEWGDGRPGQRLSVRSLRLTTDTGEAAP